MTIVVFLIDTSASMNQRSYVGPSFLDLAKGAVDTFIKFRLRDPATRGGDRYMLMTFEEPPKHIKAGFRENQLVFMQELKNLKATGLTSSNAALSNAFHYLNANRLSSGVDNFGGGRFPNWLEPAAIIVITDGGCMTNPSGNVRQTIEISPSQLPGSELVAEPFRWDQRVFSLVFRLAGSAPKTTTTISTMVPQDTSPVDSICEATGGRSYSITSQKMINQCLESIVQKIQGGVVVMFEKFGPDPGPIGGAVMKEDAPKSIPLENGFLHQPNSKLPTPLAPAGNNHVITSTTPNNNNATNQSDTVLEKTTTMPSMTPSSPTPPTPEPIWAKTKRMIYVPRGFGTRSVFAHSQWTIPEAFWPDHTTNVLPPRSAHPTIKFRCDPQEPVFPPDLPFDKYEMEPSPLTQYILERKQPNVCWYCYVGGSNGKTNDPGAPFGFLRASSTLSNVTLTVLPYNFPAFLPLFDEIKMLKGKPNAQWKAKFDRYLRSVPPYYITSLRTAFQKLNFAHLLNDVSDKYLSVGVQAHLGKVKLRAKEEIERLNQSIGHTHRNQEGIRVTPRSTFASLLNANKMLLSGGGGGEQQLKIDANEFNGFRIHAAIIDPSNGGVAKSSITVGGQNTSSSSFRNPFDINRDQLLVQIAKMRVNLRQSLCNTTAPQLAGAKPGLRYRLQDVEDLHQLPIGLMGNYQDYLRAQTPPLRDIDATPARVHAFGNPFKVDKRMLVDEADIDNLVGSAATAATGQQTNASPASPGGTGGGRSHTRKGSAASGGGGGGAAGGVARSPAPISGQDGRHPSTSSSISSSTSSEMSSSMSRKRKPGPLPKNFRWKRRRGGEDDGSSSIISGDDSLFGDGRSSPALSDVSSRMEDDTSSLVSTSRASTPGLMEEMEIESSEAPSIAPEKYSKNKTAQDGQKPSTSTANSNQSSSSSSSTMDLPKAGLAMLSRLGGARSAGGGGGSSGGENGDANKKRIARKPTPKPPKPVVKMSAIEWMNHKKEISAQIRKPTQDQHRSFLDKLDRLPRINHGLYAWALSEAERFRRTELCDRLRKRIEESKNPPPPPPASVKNKQKTSSSSSASSKTPNQKNRPKS